MKIEIKCVIIVVLTSLSVRAITHYRLESSRTIEKQKTEIRWHDDSKDGDFKGQREIVTVAPTTTSAVELVDAKEVLPDKTPSPIVVAYFVANLGDKTVQNPRNLGNIDYANRYGGYRFQNAGFSGHLALNKPYTGYRHAPESSYGYGYGYGGYGYGQYGYSKGSYGYGYGYGYPVLGKFGRKLRRMRDRIMRGFTKMLF